MVECCPCVFPSPAPSTVHQPPPARYYNPHKYHSPDQEAVQVVVLASGLPIHSQPILISRLFQIVVDAHLSQCRFGDPPCAANFLMEPSVLLVKRGGRRWSSSHFAKKKNISGSMKRCERSSPLLQVGEYRLPHFFPSFVFPRGSLAGLLSAQVFGLACINSFTDAAYYTHHRGVLGTQACGQVGDTRRSSILYGRPWLGLTLHGSHALRPRLAAPKSHARHLGTPWPFGQPYRAVARSLSRRSVLK